MVKRLIASTKSDTKVMTATELKTSIYTSEGRVVMGQHHIMLNTGLVDGVTNAEIQAAFGADMIMFNGYNMINPDDNRGFIHVHNGEWSETAYTLDQVKEWTGVPIGLYLECVNPEKGQNSLNEGCVATRENLERLKVSCADFVVLGGNPASGTSMETIIESTRLAKAVLGDSKLICAGKWEDGVTEKVLADPLSHRPSNDIIKDLIDAGADVITLPAPGSRHGITVEHVRACVEFIHTYKPGTLALSFLNSSVEGADVDTIRLIALMMKQTGADIHAIGDGGYAGTAQPENIHQLALTIKGRRHTIKRMVGRAR